MLTSQIDQLIRVIGINSHSLARSPLTFSRSHLFLSPAQQHQLKTTKLYITRYS